MGPEWNTIVQVRSSQLDECVRLEGVPLIDALQVSVVEDPNAPAGVAPALYKSLLNRIIWAGGVVRREACNGPQGRKCIAYREPNCRCLLVVVSGTTPIDQSLQEEMLDWNRHGPGEDTVLPILPGGSKPSVVLGSPLDKTIVVFHHGHVDDTADAVVTQTGLGGLQRRLFISYRRRDTRDLAEQLFDAFSRLGFQVFLDRFSGTPGRLLPNELSEEIVDKGVVLVLESAGLDNSPWTLAEVGFAYLLQIGLLAVNVDNSPSLGLIGHRDRLSLPRGPRGVLSNPDLLLAIRFVRREYPRQMLGRRLFLEALLRLGLKRHGIVPRPLGGGVFGVVGGGRRYAVGLADRAPSVTDVRRASGAATGGALPVVLGPHQFLAPERRRDLHWLLQRAGASVMGEGEITTKCAAIARGSLKL